MSKIVTTLSCDSAAEAHEMFAVLAGSVSMSTVDAVVDLIATPREPAEAPAAEPKPKPKSKPKLKSAPAAEPEPEPISLDAAIETLKAFGRERGAVALKDVLDQLGVRRATEIRPEQVSDLIAAMDGAAA
jgi:hypothetical protein